MNEFNPTFEVEGRGNGPYQILSCLEIPHFQRGVLKTGPGFTIASVRIMIMIICTVPFVEFNHSNPSYLDRVAK